MTTISLDGIWSVRAEAMDCIGAGGLARVQQAAEGWMDAQVPGEIHLDLMRAGQMLEPTVGANMPECRWPETKSWWYRTQFEAGAAFLAYERQQLETHAVEVPANGMAEVASAPLDSAARDPREWLYAAVLGLPDGQPVDQSVWKLTPHRDLALADPVIEVEDAGDGWLEVSSQVYCHAVHVEDRGRQTVSDNWFDLLPGVPVRIRHDGGESRAPLAFEGYTAKPARA